MFRYFTVLLAISLAFASQSQSLIDSLRSVEKKGISISNVDRKKVDDKVLFFKKGSSKPYTGVIYAKYPNGFYKTWREFENGVGHGSFINFYKNGSPSELGTYDESRIEGPIIKFHVNGARKEKGNYRNWRVRIGEWTFYDSNGRLSKKENYGTKGDFSELELLLQRGAISSEFYQSIIDENSIFQ